MFERNMLTFNPGWDGNARKLEEFTDLRELQRRLKAQDVKPAGVMRLAGGCRRLATASDNRTQFL
jgi:hypothetical protein